MGKMIVKVVDGKGNVICRNEMFWNDGVSAREYTKKQQVCGVKITRDNGEVLVDTTGRKGDFNKPHFRNNNDNHKKDYYKKKSFNDKKKEDKVEQTKPEPSIEKALENMNKQQQEKPKEEVNDNKKKADKKAIKAKLNNIAKDSLKDYYDDFREYEEAPTHQKIVKSNRKGE